MSLSSIKTPLSSATQLSIGNIDPVNKEVSDLKPETISVDTQLVDGGPRGYLTTLGAFLACFATFGQVNAFGSYQAWYAEHQLSSYSSSEISWIGSVQLWALFFSSAFIGRLFDAYGPKALLLSGTVVYVFSIMITSIASRYYEFMIAQGLIFGVGAGLVYSPAVSATATHFIRYRATATSLAMAGGGVGGVVFPILFQHLSEKMGFAWAIRISGFISLACCFVSCITISSRLQPQKPGPWVDTTSFRDVKFMIQTAGFCVSCFGLFVPWTYIVQYAQSRSISPALSFVVLSVLNGAGMFGRLAPGYAADKLGRFNTMVPSMFLTGLVCVTLWFNAHDFPTLVAFAVLYGIFGGAVMGLDVACVAEISQIDQIGARVGMTYAFASFPCLVGSPIAGALLSVEREGFNALIIYTGVASLVASGLFLTVRLMINRSMLAVV
ncbi:MFS general substrate transporter [Hygrophoropsis aurantiaca]|uniref:MFS general substrate transporter n=1 Tax=Hygrophoropsis aurantiaca TaxID=72124 RepID=A0ACB8A9I3_9AGAM|nr:MFS general substrate transporter [Hygrophoropsis aurantiaca]